MSDPLTTAVAASVLANGAILSELVQSLRRKGVLADREAVEIYEAALTALEQQQGASPGLATDVFPMARELIEQHLRPTAK